MTGRAIPVAVLTLTSCGDAPEGTAAAARIVSLATLCLAMVALAVCHAIAGSMLPGRDGCATGSGVITIAAPLVRSVLFVSDDI